MYHAGAGMDLTEAVRPAFIPVKGLTVGLVAFCYGPSATRFAPGGAPHDFKTMRKALRVARAAADVVVAALHDGLEYSDVPPSETRGRFRFLAENGADIVVGHHPHVLQGLEWVGNVPVAYSLGDFVFHNSLPDVVDRNLKRIEMGLYAPDEIERDRDKFSRGAVLSVDISGNSKRARWQPFQQGPDLRPRLCIGDARLDRLYKLDELTKALLNQKDYRHALADAVMLQARRSALKDLGLKDVLKLALQPKWRYLPNGLRWLGQRMSST
jgi:hypothetical protein